MLGLTYISQQSCAVKIFRRQIVTRKRKKQIPLKYSRKQYHQKVQFSQPNNILAFSFYDGKNYLNSLFYKLSWDNMILDKTIYRTLLTIAHDTSVEALVIKVHVVDDVGVGVSPPGALNIVQY